MQSETFNHDPVRDEVQSLARESGINEAFISELVETFYTRVRAHETLGPIFEAEIGDNWEPHLAKMKRFWGGITLYTGEYRGRPVQAHRKLVGVTEEHFEEWLGLFRSTLADLAPNAEVEAVFAGKAQSIATSLQLAMGIQPVQTR